MLLTVVAGKEGSLLLLWVSGKSFLSLSELYSVAGEEKKQEKEHQL